MPFITVIGVIKVDHLQDWCNCALAGFFFFMDYCSLDVKNIGLEALCHLDPRDPPRNTPQPAPPPRAAFCSTTSAQGYLPIPLIYIYFPWQHLFIGALHIWHTSLREP